jgi:hypothetical protein
MRCWRCEIFSCWSLALDRNVAIQTPPESLAADEADSSFAGGAAASRSTGTSAVSGKRNDGFPPIAFPTIQTTGLMRLHQDRWAIKENPPRVPDAKRTMFDELLTKVEGTVMERYQGQKQVTEQTLRITPDTFEILVKGGGVKGTTKSES